VSDDQPINYQGVVNYQDDDQDKVESKHRPEFLINTLGDQADEIGEGDESHDQDQEGEHGQ